VVGGSALLAITRLAGARVTLPREKLPSLMLVALFNITGWHLFSAYALLYTGSGRAAIIGYTMPIWASVLSVLVLHERIGARRVLALALGMAGLALLLGQDLGQVGAAPTGALLMLGAASSWAIGTVLIKRFAWHPMPVMALSGWQLLIGGVPIVIGWWLWEPVPDLGALSLGSTIGLAYAVLVAMIFCQTAYFKMVTLVPANVAALAVMAVPVVGTVNWGLGRRLLSRGGSFYARAILGVQVADLTGGFKCFRREVLEAIDLESIDSTGYAFQIEMTYRALTKGFVVKELPIIFEDRRVGQSKMSRAIFLEAIVVVWKLRLARR
jgi:drug/metabolite transporter (DMT)-like permease